MEATHTFSYPHTITNSLSATDEQRIIGRIVHDGDYTPEMARHILAGTVAFLRMVGHDKNAPSVPSRMIDDGWHTFLMYTKLYRQFCLAECGRFVDHNPNDTPGKRMKNTTADTVAYMRAQEILFNEALWNSTVDECDDDCGICF